MADEIYVGSVAVGIVPRAAGFSDEAREQIVPAASGIGEEFGQRCTEGMNAAMGDFTGKWGESQAAQAAEAGGRTAEAYASEFRARAEEILRDLPPADVRADTAEATEAIDRLRANLEELRDKRIGVDMSNAEAMEKIDAVKADLDTLREKRVIINADDAEATAKIDGMKAELDSLREKRVIIDADDGEALGKIDALRGALDELRGKRIGIDMSDAEAVEKIDAIRAELDSLREKRVIINADDGEAVAKIDGLRAQLDEMRERALTVRADTGSADAKLEEMRALAEKPVEVPVRMKGGSEQALKEESEEAGTASAAGFGAKFNSGAGGMIDSFGKRLTGFLGEVGGEGGAEMGEKITAALKAASGPAVVGAVAIAAAAAFSVFGEKLDGQQKQLEATLANSGQAWDRWAGKVSATGQAMSKYGYTQDQVDTSIRNVFQITGSMTQALGAQSSIANIAASRHIELAAATKLYDQSLMGNTRSLRQLGVQTATGTTESQALATAQKMLASQVEQAGGMAQFAAAHHMSLQKAQQLAAAAAHGSVTAYNQLGMEVLPKSATAAQNYAQVQAVLNERLGGQAAAHADTFGGKISALRAELTNVAESIGVKILPYFDKFMDGIIAAIPPIVRFGGEIVRIASPVVGAFFTGLGVVIERFVGPLEHGSEAMKIFTGVVLGLVAAWAAYAAISAIVDALSPVGWIVLIVAALITLIGVITRYKKQIEDVLIRGWDAVKNAVATAWDFIVNVVRKNWVLIVGIVGGPIGEIIALIVRFHTQIGHAFEAGWNAVVHFLSGVWRDIEHGVSAGMSLIRGPVTAGMRAVQNAWRAAWNAVRSAAVSVWHGIETAVRAGVTAVREPVTTGMRAVERAWDAGWNAVRTAATRIWRDIENAVRAGVNWIASHVASGMSDIRRAWQNGWNAVRNFFTSTWHAIESAFRTAWNWIYNTLRAGLEFTLQSWRNTWNSVRNFFVSTWHAIENAFSTAWNWLRSHIEAGLEFTLQSWRNTWNSVRNFFVSVWHDIENAFSTAYNWMHREMGNLASDVRRVWGDLWNDVKNFFSSVWHDIENAFSSARNWMHRTMQDLASDIAHIWGVLWNNVKTFFGNVWRDIENLARSAWNWLRQGLTSLGHDIEHLWDNCWNAVKNAFHDAWTWIGHQASNFWNGLRSGFRSLVNDIRTIWQRVEDAAKTPVKWIIQHVYNDGIVPVVQAIAHVIGLKGLSKINVSGWASGGVVPGWSPGVDDHLVPLSGGEGILTPEATREIGGRPVIDAINRQYSGHRGGGYGNPGLGLANGGTADGNARPGGDPGGGNPLLAFGKSLVHTVSSAVSSAVKGLRNLTGNALEAGINKIINPLMNRIPGTKTPLGAWIKDAIQHWEQQLVDYIKGESEFQGGVASGASILADAMKFQGHKYVYGGPSNPQGGFDCSSFVSYILGHDFGMAIPGGSWKNVTGGGHGHGPTADAYLHWSGAKDKSSQDPRKVAAGDLLVWNTHVGFGAGPNKMFSAFDTAKGIIMTPLIGFGPSGEQLKIRQINSASSVKYNPSAGVGQWRGTVAQALGMLHLPGSLVNQVLHQIQTESAGNPNAKNDWDVNARSGNASVGLLQVVPTTFKQYHVPGTSNNILDPLANIAAAINYAEHTYGRSLMRGGMGLGSGHGYAAGGRPSPGEWAWVGEEGPELAYFAHGGRVLSHEDSLAAASRNVPGSGALRGFACGGALTPGGAPLPAANGGDMSGVEQRLDTLIKATRGVGSDVGRSLNTTGRIAGHRTAFGGR
ncbi:MAG: transglycosylase SLT domain-containing protein [Actinomycetia bacterium]|nr:transglycosylase SLT domain-containing protein [Actinomycetes bacterium]